MFAHTNRALVLVLALSWLAPARADYPLSSLKSGKPDVKSIGALAFGPEGILFIGDPQQAAIFALETNDKAATSAGAFKVQDVDTKIAGLLGTRADQIRITDMAVNPLSGNAYLGVSRGSGPAAIPVLVKVDRADKVTEVPLENVRFAKAELTNPAANPKQRALAITQMTFAKDRLYVAGLANEEFASTLRVIPFPFQGENKGAGVEIYHGSHGRLETNAPIRTFAVCDLAGEPTLLASYTCTPLVRIAIGDLKPGAKVKGTTVAELGNYNTPLDMVVYQKDGKDYVLMANDRRGLMKIALDQISSIEPITKRVPKVAGLSYETLKDYKNSVKQLGRLDKDNALLLVQNDAGRVNLETLALP